MSESKSTPISSNVKSPSYDLTIPITTTALGYSIGGIYGAMLGLSIGTADEVLYQHGYTEQRYLSAMFIGAGMFVSPQKDLTYNGLATGLGATLALTLSTGIAQQYPVIIQAIENAVLGGMLNGPYGVAAGITCAAIDAGLAHYNITSYTHCSSALKGFVFTQATLPSAGKIGNSINLKLIENVAKSSVISAGLAGAVAAYSAYSTNTKTQNILPALQLAQQLHDTCSSVMDKKEVNGIFEKSILVSAGLGVVAQKNMNAIFGVIKTLENIPSGSNFLTTALPDLAKIAYYYPGYAISNFVQGEFVNYFLYDLQSQMEENTYNELYKNETLLKVQRFPNTEDQLDWVGGDILTAIQGLRTVTSATSTYTTAIIASQIIKTAKTFDIVILTSAFNQFTGQITQYFAKTTTNLWEQFIKGMSNIATAKKGTIRNSEDIALNNAINFELEKTLEAAKDLRKTDLASGNQRTLVGTWDYTQTTFSNILSLALLKISSTKSNSDILQLANANSQIVAMVTWSNNNAVPIKMTELSINRFNKLIEMMRDETIEPGNKIVYHTHNQPSLVLDNVRFEYNQNSIINVEYLEFKPGKIYAITGKLGSGKSIVLKYGIFGITQTSIQGYGDITYPADKKLVAATQDVYIPLKSTLYEVIMAPKTPTESSLVKSEYLSKIQILMDNLGIGVLARDLDVVRDDWSKTLSGGQERMIAVMRAILQEPTILLADEIFNGMDEKSIRIAEAVIKKYLPNAIIIIVDHHALENNDDGFYSGGRVHFEDKEAVLLSMDKVNSTSYTEDFAERSIENFGVEPLGETHFGEVTL